MSEPFIAEIRMFAGNFAPRSWAFCNGQLLPIAQNTALFSLIGTTYGGDGRTTTALPNLQGRVPMHAGQGPGLTNRRLGQKIGVEMVNLTENQMPNHNHTFNGSTGRGNQNSPENHLFSNNAGAYGDAANMTTMQGDIVTTTGGSQAHNNVQPFLVVNFIIALQGLYPSRS